MSIFLDSMKRPDDMARITTSELVKNLLDKVTPAVQALVGSSKVLLVILMAVALCGGRCSRSY